MPKPVIVMCMHQHPEILLLSHIVRHYGEKLQFNSSTLRKGAGILNTLENLHRGFQTDQMDRTGNYSIEDWNSVKNDLLSRYAFSQLMGEQGYDGGNRGKELEEIFSVCQREGVDCFPRENLKNHVRLVRNEGSLQSCIIMKFLVGSAMDVASSQGIENGITVVLRSGNSFLWKALNITPPYPAAGISDFVSPSLGTSGVRLMITQTKTPDMDPDIEGIDIPLGFASTIGFKARKTIHLSHPCTNCTMENLEYKRLVQIIRQESRDISFSPWHRGKYNVLHCRYNITII